jgi:cytochrome c-type biogenesis protein CcmH
MNGWLIAAAFAFCLMVLLIAVGRIPRMSWELTAAAVLLGLAGYAWQGSPGLPGQPKMASASTDMGKFDEQLAERRRGMAERYGKAGQWLMLSDGLGRQGKTKEAANVLLAGLKQTPDDPNLWLGLGNALIAHADGVVSPSADFAYRRAMTLDPDAPAPPYFYGLALVRAGQLQAAKELWAPLAARAPEGSEIKAELELSIARIDAMLAAGTPVAQ